MTRPVLAFSGRADRPAFHAVIVTAALLQVLLVLLMVRLPEALPALLMAGIALHVPLLATMARRLHDADLSAHWLWLWALPPVGPVLLVSLLDRPGSPGRNRFGAVPRSATYCRGSVAGGLQP